MGLETASFFNDLNSAWPLGTDSGTFGDDHLRLIKSVLKSVFPGVGGNGFSQQITATEAELNNLAGLNANIMTLVSGATMPSGSILPFYNAAPPTGWSLVSTPTTRMLIVGGGYSNGGTADPLLNDTVPTHSHSSSGATISSAGAHTHTINGGAGLAGGNPFGTGNIYGGAGGVDMVSGITDSQGAHTHDITGLTIADNVGANWAPRYLGLILCSKN
jgi:hypothetical protein